MRQPLKIDWLKLEQEMRQVLRNDNLDPKDALDCLSAILGWHTGRGYERSFSDEQLLHFQSRFPMYFSRID